MSETTYEYSPGLAGVPCAKSSVCYLDGSIGKLQYRGYPIEALAESCTYEEVAHLLLIGELPKAAELAAFDALLRKARAVPATVLGTLKSLPATTHPMTALSIGVSSLAAHIHGDHQKSAAFRRDAAIQLVAKLPTIVAAWERVRSGKEPISPNSALAHAANFLYMLDGKEPDALVAHTMDVALVLHAEHQMNASTFAARVTGSTLADPSTTMASAIGALSGPLHGGANEEVLKMIATIPASSPDTIRAWAEDRLAKKAKISGFGHREYKVKDPRASILQNLSMQVFAKFGATPDYGMATELEKQMATLTGAKGVYPNVDFYSGILYSKLGIATDLFTPIFAIARISGWLAHWLEQLEDNRIFRPNQIWTGSADRNVTQLAAR
ncbi:MAG: citrate synthase [Sandaracinaceae bacterium]|nr:citrate synthase [Sandaracinaceae bacterium]